MAHKIRNALIAPNYNNANLDSVEVDTGAKLLGKTIYRKVLTLAAGPNASTVNTAHGLTIASTGQFTRVAVAANNGTNWLCFDSGGFLSDTLAHSITVAIDGTNVGLTSGTGGDYHLYSGVIILEYTKS